MHVVRPLPGTNRFDVGYFKPAKEGFEILMSAASFGAAAAYCSWLNGGLQPALSDMLHAYLDSCSLFTPVENDQGKGVSP